LGNFQSISTVIWSRNWFSERQGSHWGLGDLRGSRSKTNKISRGVVDVVGDLKLAAQSSSCCYLVAKVEVLSLSSSLVLSKGQVGYMALKERVHQSSLVHRVSAGGEGIRDTFTKWGKII